MDTDIKIGMNVRVAMRREEYTNDEINVDVGKV